VALVMLVAFSQRAVAQTGSGGGAMEAKLSALKQSAAENKQKLHQYQWVETQQVTYKGEAKPQKIFQCSYGANDQVVKIPMNSPQQDQQQQQGRMGRRQQGAMKERIVEKKKAEMKDYMEEVQGLLAMYVPPNPQGMQAAFQGKKVSLQKDTGDGTADIVFNDYAKPGDKMTIGFDTNSKKIGTINVSTYLDEPKDAVSLGVQMASLPDGTNYTQQSVLNASAKQIQVTTTNSNYVKIR
jgi:hypothetical protein